jgi:hypothetical protein
MSENIKNAHKDGLDSYDKIDCNEILFIESDIENLQFQSFDPFTHVFIFAFSYSHRAMAKAFDLIHAR